MTSLPTAVYITPNLAMSEIINQDALARVCKEKGTSWSQEVMRSLTRAIMLHEWVFTAATRLHFIFLKIDPKTSLFPGIPTDVHSMQEFRKDIALSRFAAYSDYEFHTMLMNDELVLHLNRQLHPVEIKEMYFNMVRNIEKESSRLPMASLSMVTLYCLFDKIEKTKECSELSKIILEFVSPELKRFLATAYLHIRAKLPASYLVEKRAIISLLRPLSLIMKALHLTDPQYVGDPVRFVLLNEGNKMEDIMQDTPRLLFTYFHIQKQILSGTSSKQIQVCCVRNICEFLDGILSDNKWSSSATASHKLMHVLKASSRGYIRYTMIRPNEAQKQFICEYVAPLLKKYICSLAEKELCSDGSMCTEDPVNAFIDGVLWERAQAYRSRPIQSVSLSPTSIFNAQQDDWNIYFPHKMEREYVPLYQIEPTIARGAMQFNIKRYEIADFNIGRDFSEQGISKCLAPVGIEIREAELIHDINIPSVPTPSIQEVYMANTLIQAHDASSIMRAKLLLNTNTSFYSHILSLSAYARTTQNITLMNIVNQLSALLYQLTSYYEALDAELKTFAEL